MKFVFLHVGNEIWAPTILVRSLRALHPNAEIIQCSDRISPEIADVSLVNRLDDDPSKLMTFRLKSFSRVEGDGPTWFLDTDMICTGELDPSSVLQESNVALCARHFSVNTVINAGFGSLDLSEYRGMKFGTIYPYLACTTLTNISEFWRDCLENLNQLHPKFHLWFGDQEAIRNVAQLPKYRVTQLPESVYACPPEFENPANPPKIIHYKGNRKPLMQQRARRMGLLAQPIP